MTASALERLAAAFGIAHEYYDIGGARHSVPEHALRRLLNAMEVEVPDGLPEEDIHRILRQVEDGRWRRRLEPVVVGREGAGQVSIVVAVPEAEAGRALHWLLAEEDGSTRQGMLEAAALEVRERREIDGEAWFSAIFGIPAPAATGYHRFQLRDGAASGNVLAECLLIFAPPRCFTPQALEEGQRMWGLTAQLYGVRSQRNWGIGDFTDLLRLVEFAAGEEAAFVGLNPLHSPLRFDDAHASPYDPSSRRFLNALYLDVEAIPEFAESSMAQQLVADGEFQAELRRLRASDSVDYAAAGKLKMQVLELLFESFREAQGREGSARARAFDDYRQARGELLHRFAAFQVLYEYGLEQDPNAWGWPAWPETLRDPCSAEAAELVSSRNDRLEFFMYLQWNAELQLGAAAGRAAVLGMPIGIYSDLALSSKNGGADTWIDGDLYLRGAHIGAPPDPFNQAGQDWGLPPWNPARLRETGYRPFIETLHANMRIGGALRIDHVMALMRCFLLPQETEASEGTYVHYAFDEMLAILALESRRHSCLVIGEDLGTVPDEVRRGLHDAGVLGYRVLWFEKSDDGSYRAPLDFDRDVLTVISTHDLPTLAGFWQGADIEWRTEHQLFPSVDAREQQLIGRAGDRARLLMALEKERLVPEDTDTTEVLLGAEMTAALHAAFHRYLARTRSLLVGVQAEDLLGESAQANLPGTTDEHPNWRRRLSLQLESWADEPRVKQVLAAVQDERPHNEPEPAAREAAPSRRAIVPRATYRVQLHRDFGFAELDRLLPYLETLGISHVYCSPYMKAREGSRHGYDVIDHNALNPEIGDRAALDRLCVQLKERGMGHILDMVPNHMAVTGRDHEWWLDVLENGPASRYADFFDIDWQPLKEELRGKVLLPVLGDHYGNVLDRGDLKLVFDAEQGRFDVEYFEHRFPIDPREYPRVLEPELDLLRRRLDESAPSLAVFESLLTAFGNLPPRSSSDDDSRRARARDQKLDRERLAELVADEPDVRRYIDECLRIYNGDELYPADISRLHLLLEAQAYRLAYWRVASHEINYRRFFDINELASLRMENPEVFEATHGLVLELIDAGMLDGLRIDHPDGLYDPRGYFRTLQERAGGLPAEASDIAELPLYLVVEKILASDERLRGDWSVHGTTGYEFANLVNRLLTSPDGMDVLEETYSSFIGRGDRYDEILRRSKILIMQTSLASELNVLTSELERLAEQDRHTRDFGLGGLRNALLETVACFPVYRTYTVNGEVSPEDEAIIDHAVNAATELSEAADTSVFGFVRDVLLNRSASGRSEELKDRVARFGMRLQQYTSPVAAKGMEDTAFYRYANLVSLNEVGGTPGQPAMTIEEFHRANGERMQYWPHSMLATSTHDTKRSEDVRARLAVLSEIPDEWRRHVGHWAKVNEPLTRAGDDGETVDRNTEYFLYQTLVGAWPPAACDEDPAQGASFAERISAYMIKAVKEAKRRSSWLNPNPAYEAAVQHFAEALLEPASNADFMEDFLPFQRRVARLGAYNGLAQQMLKLTCPGVPDVYQGTELWRLDLVDPDNRRPVDFERREKLLDELRRAFDAGRGPDCKRQVFAGVEDDRAKLFLTWRALSLRSQYPALFERGSYVPLEVTGDHAGHVCAFTRCLDGEVLVVAVLRWFARLVDSSMELEPKRLADTTIRLPVAARYLDALSGEVTVCEDAETRASAVFADAPVAMWLEIAG